EVSPFFSFSNNRYAGDTTVTPTLSVRRLENVYTYGLDVAYNMNKWIALTLGYNHNQKVSTIKTFDYTQNTVSFMVSATL
ncbi:MAG TPA: outer membrane beta-barrel protein, partial [Nitrospirota bacterium]